MIDIDNDQEANIFLVMLAGTFLVLAIFSGRLRNLLLDIKMGKDEITSS